MFVAPHTGGIYSFARKLSAVLGDRLLTAELEGEAERWTGHDASLAGPEHAIIPVDGSSAASAARSVCDWIAAQAIDIVLVTPMTPTAVIDALPHLPANVRIVSRLTEISVHSYRMALRQQQALDLLIVQAPRQQSDLSDRLDGLPVALVPNGVDTGRFAAGAPNHGAALRLLFLDRLVDEQKQVFALPTLCQALDEHGGNWRLSIGGEGPDAADLRARLTPWMTSGKVIWLGHVAGDSVPRIMADHDLYLKFSRNEGSPNAVLEAMAAGLPTIAMAIGGVMDFVIEDAVTGWIVPQGDIGETATLIGALDADRKAITAAGLAARARAEAEFSLASFAGRIAAVEAQLADAELRQPADWGAFATTQRELGPLKRLTKRLVPRRWRAAAREALGR